MNGRGTRRPSRFHFLMARIPQNRRTAIGKEATVAVSAFARAGGMALKDYDRFEPEFATELKRRKVPAFCLLLDIWGFGPSRGINPT
jgi:hypothetical protein